MNSQNTSQSDDLSPHPVIAALFSVFIPGSGHVYSGAFRSALTILVMVSTWLLISSFLLALHPFMVPVVAVGSLLLNLAITTNAYLTAERRAQFSAHFLLSALYILVFVGVTWVELQQFARVHNYSSQSTTMKPTLLPGDRFTIDRFYTDFKPGDVVAVELEDHEVLTRRVQSLHATTVVVTTDSTDHSVSQELPTAALQGRVLYILYSIDPESLQPRWQRFLSYVQ